MNKHEWSRYLMLASFLATSAGFAQDVRSSAEATLSGALPRAPQGLPRAPLVDRLQHHMNRGALIGSGLGLVYGLAVEPRTGERVPLVLTDVLIGGGIGILAGAATGVVARSGGRATRLATPGPLGATRAPFERMSRYMGVGGQLGAGMGAVVGAYNSTGNARGIATFASALAGFTGGLACGALVYLVSAANR